MTKTIPKLAFILLAIAVVIVAYIFDIHTLLTLDKLQSMSTTLTDFVSKNPVSSFFIAFVAMTVVYSLPLPAAALMSLTAGYIFHFSIGLVLVLSASLLAASLTFLIARYVAREWLTQKFSRYMQKIDSEMQNNGFFYALSIRMVPGIPFIALNTSLGVTNLSLKGFALSTLLGILPISSILVNAGSQFTEINHISDVLTPQIFLSLLLLASFPLIARFLSNYFLKKQC